MRTPFLQGRKKPKAPDKPPYATASRSRNIPDDDPKPRVNADYMKPPTQLIGGRLRYHIKMGQK